MFLLVFYIVFLAVCDGFETGVAFPAEVAYYPVTLQAKVDGLNAGNQVCDSTISAFSSIVVWKCCGGLERSRDLAWSLRLLVDHGSLDECAGHWLQFGVFTYFLSCTYWYRWK